jgi:hypothetical protein
MLPEGDVSTNPVFDKRFYSGNNLRERVLISGSKPPVPAALQKFYKFWEKGKTSPRMTLIALIFTDPRGLDEKPDAAR